MADVNRKHREMTKFTVLTTQGQGDETVSTWITEFDMSRIFVNIVLITNL